ncbi:MAG: heme-dependent peroxidase [Planctomycetota bacterium]|nr:MAG: heme-dependent peroxidase [Planctomycetota bacterium]REK29259.1 MAG: heme-dependent peroxidase [Planctomycetota bacterium]REK29450.1 MAG: heme-dependent peroxidase [Planctomycetota bacterium]
MPDPTIRMTQGWHCLHIYYRVDPGALAGLDASARGEGREQLIEILNPQRDGAPERMQVSAVSGHRADLGLMLLDADPLKIDAVHQAVRGSRLGAALQPTYSFVSITEVSEYVPNEEQYAEQLRADGMSPDDPAYAARLKAYAGRLPAMNKQRLYPDFPENFEVTCFYPMNKIRHPSANWFTLPFSARRKLMAEHATSGIKFAGRVSQLITASTGFDDWEWGVTLWAGAPEYIKEIVYTMRFDEASARYAEFGPFYISYIMPAPDALTHLHL